MEKVKWTAEMAIDYEEEKLCTPKLPRESTLEYLKRVTAKLNKPEQNEAERQWEEYKKTGNHIFSEFLSTLHVVPEKADNKMIEIIRFAFDSDQTSHEFAQAVLDHLRES